MLIGSYLPKSLAGFWLMFLPSALATSATSPHVNSIEFTDTALQNCVRAHASTQNYQTVADVKEIPCWNLGIRSIKGLEQFTEALVIDLSNNQITDWSPLYGLGNRLGYLDIHGNKIKCDDMVGLARQLPHASLVGFDPRSCSAGPDDGTPPPAPAPTPAPKPSRPEPSPQPAPSSPPYASVAGIIAANCGPCHQNGRHKGGVRLDDEANVGDAASYVLSSIQSGRMPPGDSDWQNSADGRTLIAYLQTKATNNPNRGRPRTHGDDDDDDDRHEGGHRHGGHHGHGDDD